MFRHTPVLPHHRPPLITYHPTTTTLPLPRASTRHRRHRQSPQHPPSSPLSPSPPPSLITTTVTVTITTITTTTTNIIIAAAAAHKPTHYQPCPPRDAPGAAPSRR